MTGRRPNIVRYAKRRGAADPAPVLGRADRLATALVADLQRRRVAIYGLAQIYTCSTFDNGPAWRGPSASKQPSRRAPALRAPASRAPALRAPALRAPALRAPALRAPARAVAPTPRRRDGVYCSRLARCGARPYLVLPGQEAAATPAISQLGTCMWFVPGMSSRSGRFNGRSFTPAGGGSASPWPRSPRCAPSERATRHPPGRHHGLAAVRATAASPRSQPHDQAQRPRTVLSNPVLAWLGVIPTACTSTTRH